MITTCWSDDPKKRWEVRAVGQLFLTSSLQEVQNANSGNWNTWNTRDHDRKFLNIKTGQQRRGRFLPRITSLFQFLQVPEPEIERLVNEMDKASSSTFSTFLQDQYELQRLENEAMSDRDRLKLFNKFCKTCSRHRVIPKSMHIPDCSGGSVEVTSGGSADVSQGVYEGRRVAIKVVRVYITSDLNAILSVSLLPALSYSYG